MRQKNIYHKPTNCRTMSSNWRCGRVVKAVDSKCMIVAYTVVASTRIDLLISDGAGSNPAGVDSFWHLSKLKSELFRLTSSCC